MKMKIANFMRIQGRDLSYRTKKPVGVFSLGWRLIKNGIMTKEEENLFVSIDQWFKENLPEPPIYSDDNLIGAITYFKVENTSHMFEELKPIMKIFKKHNVAFDIVYTDFVGKIVYEDEYQIAVVDT